MKRQLTPPTAMFRTFLFALTLATVACTSDDFIGDQSLAEANGQTAISFSSGVPAVTRADKTGADAATDLNEKFYVWGIKNEGGTGGDGIGDAGTGNLVYNNYVVEWADNSAMTSTSNTEGWEYVGKTLDAKEIACITTNGGDVTQTIKYWDFGANDYTFYAFSADPNDLNATTSSAKVQVAKTKSVSGDGKTVYDKGYSVTLAAGANLDKLFFSERVNITASANTERRVDNTYGGNVTFRFHNGSTKVRVAMYETIPGYTVTIDKFLVDNDGTDPTFAQMDDDVTANFAANLQNSKKGDAGTLTVTYNSVAGATQNWPILSFSPTSGKNKVLTLGTGLSITTVLGRTVANATYDKTDKSYTSVFPNEGNTQKLKLKVNYTLTATNASEDATTTGETIKIEGATAEIPAAYLKWKPGFAYTYIFKISDNTNGSSGQGVVGLYPITFDAVEIVAEDGQAEYITTVSEPSITTFGVKDGKYSAGKAEYEAGSDVYATIMDGSSVKDFTLDSDVKVYAVTTSDATNFPITEASVAESLAESATGTKKITTTQITSSTYSTYLNAAPSKETTVPGEDGVNKTITALKLTGVKYVADYVYAVEYITGKWNTIGKTYESSPSGVTLYSDADGTTTTTWANNSTTYYTRTVPKNVYKIIKVAATP